MNRRSTRGDISRATAALCFGTICLVGWGDLPARDVQVGRYASLIAAPTEAQADLLSTMVTVKFPSRVENVGEAVRHLLRGSGYLKSAATVSPDRFSGI